MIIQTTPARRLEIYKAALDRIYQQVKWWGSYDYGFCNVIDKMRKVTWEEEEPSPHFGGLRHYPELYAYKPDDINDKIKDVYWWDCDADGTTKRINVLNEIISKMEAK